MQGPGIAIVGQGCVLPGALTPAALWELVRDGRSAISPAPPEEWRLGAHVDRARLAREIASDAGGYVRGFDSVFDPSGLLVPAERIAGLDPVFLWTLHAAREALRSAGVELAPRPDGVVVLGNLSYPTPGLVDLVEEIWLPAARQREDPRNRFMSGLPALLAAEAVGFGGGAFALDAACASSLYAIKLACDRLNDGSASIALAGGVNDVDDLFCHLGFTALGALSPTGSSRPFHREADGLVPARGAAFVVLERLRDAEAAGRPILGVIRGVGLSNDGRSRGLLVPSEDGQVRAMRAAYAASGLSPADVSLVECHATGTVVGDAVELRSMSTVFEGCRDVPLGSLKSNLGHLVTASGIASLIKVLAAMGAGMRPPTLHVDEPLHPGPLRLLGALEPWPSDGPRRAAVSNFGFGGNNAHLVVEQWPGPGGARAKSPPRPDGDIAIVAMAVTAGAADSIEAFDECVLTGRSVVGPGPEGAVAADFEIDVSGSRFPPADLQESLAQQTLLLRAALELRSTIEDLAPERTSILVGMQCDAEIPRRCLHFRDPRAAAGAPVTAASALGCMPNIVANRLSHQLDLRAPSFTVSAEEASGTVALDLAVRSLRSFEIDAALVAAVDLSCEPVHRAAAEAVLPAHRHVPGDAAVMLVCKRAADARRDRDPILAILGTPTDTGTPVRLAAASGWLGSLFGHAHAASGLLHVAAAVRCCDRRAQPAARSGPERPWLPRAGTRRVEVVVDSLGGGGSTTSLWTDPTSRPSQPGPEIHLAVFTAGSVDGLLRALEAPAERGGPPDGDHRLAIVASGDGELAERIGRARTLLRAHGPGSSALSDEGIHFGAGPVSGELGFVFTGPAGAYPHMGRELALALPELVDRLGERTSRLIDDARWIYEEDPAYRATPAQKLGGASFLTQLHAELTRGLLEMRPGAAIGYCSGETNALFALGAWTDADGFMRAVDESGVYTRELGGELSAVRRAWEVAEGEPVAWSARRVRVPLDEVRAAIATERRVHVTIVNTPNDIIIGGDPAGLSRVAARLGAQRVTPLDFDFVMHCPEARAYEAGWRALHVRPATPVPGVRFYTHATLSSYAPTAEAAAEALTAQAMNPIDFPALIERAWTDGVRLFLEHGPHAGCTKWIREILGEREHVAVALDTFGRSSLVSAAQAVARLVAAGVPMNHRALAARLRPQREGSPEIPRGAPWKKPLPVRFRVHGKPVERVAEDRDDVQIMAPAPKLPPALAASLRISSGARALPPNASREPRPGSLSLLEQVASEHAALAELHVAYLRQQSDLQQHFLRLVLAPVEPAEVARAARAAAKDHPPLGAAEGRRAPTGPRFGRADLEVLASGRISSVFGPLFEEQDGWARQVRMPQPPLLLADRVLGIEGEPRSMGVGTIWTETDVTADAWYLHEGRMPAGILAESGQADLLLISWLGIDFENRGERVYRLLGCDLTVHGELPRPGDTLRYEIHVDGHARQGDVRLFFFHYDCHVNGEVRVTVRSGQAGFFTERELAESAGILWTAATATPTEAPRLDPPAANCDKDRFSAADVAALVAGNAYGCFGAGFERALTHTRTPTIQGGPLRLVDEVTHFDRAGGPWGRGYLRARLALRKDHWFFPGHFKNDPCMPGTLMFEGGLQAMSMYLAALGYTLDRDGWRFEPEAGHTISLCCRGQALPTSQEVVYEVFVEEIVAGPLPTLYADLLGSVDGLPSFHCTRVALRLVPAFPLDEGRVRIPAPPDDGAPIARIDGLAFDFRSLMAFACGRPSEAFGEMVRRFDGTRRMARAPGPPFAFMTRVRRVEGPMGGMQVGTVAEVDYDVPADAWYFGENAVRVMPFAVLLEVALQACGWVAAYIGAPCISEVDRVFRNLDGKGTVHREVHPDVGRLTTTSKLTSCSTAGGITLVGFDATVRAGDDVVYTLETVFGFFPPQAMREQVGLPTAPELAAALGEVSDVRIDLAGRPERFFRKAPRLSEGRLLGIDRVTGLWPAGGTAGLGRIRAENDVDPAAWFFKAHFFQDPVQPGSLGLEAMLQALELLLLERGAASGIESPRFEALALGAPMEWKYRGQVLPENERVVVDVEVTSTGEDARGRLVVADGSLWVQGKRIYGATGLSVRIVGG